MTRHTLVWFVKGAAFLLALAFTYSAPFGCADGNEVPTQPQETQADVVGYVYNCYGPFPSLARCSVPNSAHSQGNQTACIEDARGISAATQACQKQNYSDPSATIFAGPSTGTIVGDNCAVYVEESGYSTSSLARLNAALSPIVAGCYSGDQKQLTLYSLQVGGGGDCRINKCTSVLRGLANATLLSSGFLDTSKSPSSAGTGTYVDCVDCSFRFTYDCTHTEEPTACCTEPSSPLCDVSRSASFGLASSGGTYTSRLASTQVAGLQDQTDTSNSGFAIGDAEASRLAFDLTSAGLSIKTLRLSFSDFVFDGEDRHVGSAILANTVTAAPVAGDPNAYSIPPGGARFSILAVDDQDKAYAVAATNSTNLVISELDAWHGPHITGSLTGNVSTHTVQADLDAPFAWLNRPPTAAPRAVNVRGDSSNTSLHWCTGANAGYPCHSSLDCPKGKCVAAQQQTCFNNGQLVHWTGVPGARFPVMLDGSLSDDPDTGPDSLVYSWGGTGVPAVSGKQTTIYLPQGSYEAVLTVQDPQGVSAVNTVQFTVTDNARPTCNGLSKTKLIHSKFVNNLPIPEDLLGSLDQFAMVTSPAASIPVSKATKKDVQTLIGSRAAASRIIKAAMKPDFGVPGLRSTQFPSPFSTACGAPGAPPLVCTGCGNGMCEQGEDCATCPADCGVCTRCGDGRCDGTVCLGGSEAGKPCIDNGECPGSSCNIGETCSNCQADCGECNPCGNGHCDWGETISTCPADCYCGDGLCEPGEDGSSCPKDCYCGNSTCDAGETAAACPNDCRCGDHICDASETATSCPQDCPCGNGVCDATESHATCPSDCFCGNGTCDADEDCSSCSSDCGCAAGSLCAAGSCVTPLLAFVTKNFFNGADIGGLAGADAKCAAEAHAAGNPNAFRAWISDSSTSAATRLQHPTLPYVMADGTRVADNWTDLTDGSIDAAITRNADGTQGPMGGAWTATNPSGGISDPSHTCSNWTSTSGQGADGYVGSANGDWTQNSVFPIDNCTVQSRLYCFQQQSGTCGNGTCDPGEDCTSCPGDCPCPGKRVFVTSAAFTGGAFGGVSGADAICQNTAQAVGLSGTYKAWIGDDVAAPPATRFMHSLVPYYKQVLGGPGIVVASNWADLIDGTFVYPIDTDENGQSLAAPSYAWTSVLADGTDDPRAQCDPVWTSSSASDGGGIGAVGQTDAQWTSFFAFQCSTANHIYCFEQ